MTNKIYDSAFDGDTTSMNCIYTGW